jgi:hypothetical protein
MLRRSRRSRRARREGSVLHERLSLFWGTPSTLRGERDGRRFPPLDRVDLIENGPVHRGLRNVSHGRTRRYANHGLSSRSASLAPVPPTRRPSARQSRRSQRRGVARRSGGEGRRGVRRIEPAARGRTRGRARRALRWRRRESNPRPPSPRQSVYKLRLPLRFARRPVCSRPTAGLAILRCRALGDWLSRRAEPVR